MRRSGEGGTGPDAETHSFSDEMPYQELAIPSPFTAIRGASRHRRSRS